ncbi:MAG: VWA domain-containing protein [Chitinivibrionales bacterium]|nr:VWA domain-containing protein [Chitinivibrionales bacterium]
MRLFQKVVFCIFSATLLLHLNAADSTCFLRIDACNLSNIDGKTIEVPLEISEISRDVKACLPEIVFQSSFQDTASIFFVIDESGSMAQNDPNGARYEITKQFLEQMYQTYPYVRVGVAVFTDRLEWDFRDDPGILSKIGNYEYNDAYIPLIPLDSVLSNNKNGLENIKEWLATDTAYYPGGDIVTLATKTTRPEERSSGAGVVGTDISLGFEAAKDAFKNSPTDPRRQYIVFLSDGDAGYVNDERLDSRDDYRFGENVPTTYTYYLCKDCSEPHANLVAMTEHIKTNGYSATNEKSSISPVNNPDTDLLGKLQNIVVENPISATVTPSGGTLTGQQSSAETDTSFVFPQAVPLSGSGVDVSVSLTWDYSYSQSGAPDDGDTTISASFTVRQSSDISLQEFDPISGLLYECIKLSAVQPAYFDTDGDGYINEIRVHLGENIASDELDSLQKRITDSDLPAHRYMSVDTIKPLRNDPKAFVIVVTQDTTKATINTTVDSDKDTLHIDKYLIKPSYENFVPGGTYAIADSMAPVLVSAVYKPFSQEKENVLEVVFSEPLDEITDTVPFKFSQDENVSYLMVVESVVEAKGKNHSFRISRIKPDLGTEEVFPKNGDLVWIYPDKVGDGNNTQKETSRKVKLAVRYPDYEYKIGAIPLSPDIDDSLRSFPGHGRVKGGAMIIIQSDVSTGDTASVRYLADLSVDIYDPIGNHIARGEYFPQSEQEGDNINIKISQEGSNFFIWWNGRNKNNRAVASGTYLAFSALTIEKDGEKSVSRDKIKVAVKR